MKNKDKGRIMLLFILINMSMLTMAQPKYNYPKLQMENLGRGVVAIRNNVEEVVISWRYLSSDPIKTAFNIYRDGVKINEVPIAESTMYIDKYNADDAALYEVRPVLKTKETHQKDGQYRLPENAPIGYVNIPIQKPTNGLTPAEEEYTYHANDASIGDVDGDGEYEIILKWNPSNAHDNAHDGYTGPVLLDCYKLNGTRLWRINLGNNIRAGSHYTPFIVYDLDGDGKAEVVTRTAVGTIDGRNNCIGNPNKDYREVGFVDKKRAQQDANGTRMPLRNEGRILSGNEYLTVFSGLTGEALKTIDYVPERGNLADWGDKRANRSDRFLAGVAYLNGRTPSVVMCRGYYTRTVLAAFDWDGKDLTQRWLFDSNNPGYEDYAGQGNHNLRIGDVDGDGCDEIIYGSCAINNDGEGLYSTKMGHGDAIHLTHFDPNRKGLQIWACHENKIDGSTYRDAATGEVLTQIKSGIDVGRCMAADIDPTHLGVEMWSLESEGILNIKGEHISPKLHRFPTNMAVWWDGDLLRELLDSNMISKYDWKRKKCVLLYEMTGVESTNGSKSTPCLQGDIIGDWREEVLMRTEDNSALRLYVSPIPTSYRFHTFLEDPIYRISIATQNVGYNQPTQPGFYFGPDLEGIFRGCIIQKEEYK